MGDDHYPNPITAGRDMKRLFKQCLSTDNSQNNRFTTLFCKVSFESHNIVKILFLLFYLETICFLIAEYFVQNLYIYYSGT